MPSLKLKISTSNNMTYSEIILRKFFTMIFISEDGKKLDIYTATVFGGVNNNNVKKKENGNAKESGSENVKEIPIASYSKSNGDMSCALDFKYEGDIILAKEVRFEDKTESLWKQADCMQKVWETCEEITTQDEVRKLFREVYPDVDNNVSFDMSDKGPVYHIYEKDKKSHECIVARGKFQWQTADGSKYRLLSDHSMEHDGMEFMNWVKAEIPLTTSILGKFVKYEIALENAKEYYTPDFTWYFAPPMGYSVEEDSATVEIAKKSMRNLVQSVADDTTVRFVEWEEEEIDDRRKARVYISSHTSDDPCVLKKGIKVSVRIDNPRQMGNRQFLLGLLVAFVLSFCSDKTRINDYFDCIQKICQCGEQCLCEQTYNFLGFLFPTLAVTTYLSMIFKIEKCVPEKKKKTRKFFMVTRATGVVATIVVLLYVFFAWLVLPDIMQRVITSCETNNELIFWFSGVGVVCNTVYILYCMISRKKKIYDFL